MNLNYFEEVTEKVLTEIGITPNEYDGLIIFILFASIAYSFLSWIIFKMKCKELSCQKVNKIFENSQGVALSVKKLEKLIGDLHIIDKTDHTHIKDNIDKVDGALSDVKSRVSELNGIMLVKDRYAGPSRRRIEHEDD
jgi:hypothetical protein